MKITASSLRRNSDSQSRKNVMLKANTKPLSSSQNTINNNKPNNIPSPQDLLSVLELSLYDSGLRSISEIKLLPYYGNLQVLNLHSNKIRKIEGISNLIYLKVLNLSSNEIEVVEGLEALPQLECLNLASNKIKVIQGLSILYKLQKLILSYNQISSLAGVSELNGPQFSLQHFDVRGNNIKSLKEISYLRGCVYLKEVIFQGSGKSNPICDEPNYIEKMWEVLPSLEILDGRDLDGKPTAGSSSLFDHGLSSYLEFLPSEKFIKTTPSSSKTFSHIDHALKSHKKQMEKKVSYMEEERISRLEATVAAHLIDSNPAIDNVTSPTLLKVPKPKSIIQSHTEKDSLSKAIKKSSLHKVPQKEKRVEFLDSDSNDTEDEDEPIKTSTKKPPKQKETDKLEQLKTKISERKKEESKDQKSEDEKEGKVNEISEESKKTNVLENEERGALNKELNQIKEELKNVLNQNESLRTQLEQERIKFDSYSEKYQQEIERVYSSHNLIIEDYRNKEQLYVDQLEAYKQKKEAAEAKLTNLKTLSIENGRLLSELETYRAANELSLQREEGLKQIFKSEQDLVNKLQSQILQASYDISEKENQMVKQTNRIQSLEHENSHLKEQIPTLQQQLYEAKKTYEECEGKYSNILAKEKSTGAVVLKEIEEKSRIELEKEVDKSKGLIEKEIQKRKELQKAYEDLAMQNAESREMLRTAVLKESEASSLVSELTQLLQKNKERSKQSKTKSQEIITTLKKQVTDLQDELRAGLTLLTNAKKQERQFNSLQQEIQSQKAEISKLQTQLSTNITPYIRECDHLREELENFENIGVDLEKCKDECAKQKEQIEKLELEVIKKSDTIKIKEKMLDDQNDTISTLKNQIKDLENEIKEIRKKESELTSLLEYETDAHQRYKEGCEQRDQTIEDLETQLEKLKRKINQIQDDILNQEEMEKKNEYEWKLRLERGEDEIKNFRGQLDGCTKLVSELRSVIESKENEISVAHQVIRRQEKEIKMIFGELEKQKKSANETKKKMRLLLTQMDLMQDEGD